MASATLGGGIHDVAGSFCWVDCFGIDLSDYNTGFESPGHSVLVVIFQSSLLDFLTKEK